MVIFGIKMTAIKFPIDRWDLISKMLRFEFLANFFHHFTYIFGHGDLDLWRKVTNFNRVWASVLSSHLAKTASKSVHPFGWNFVHKKRTGHTHRQTDTQTNCSENITPSRFRGGVMNVYLFLDKNIKVWFFFLFFFFCRKRSITDVSSTGHQLYDHGGRLVIGWPWSCDTVTARSRCLDTWRHPTTLWWWT